jgi:hypothetical protein
MLFRLNGQLVRLDPARLTAAEADQVGLTGGPSRALARRSFRPVHDQGRVLVDLAVRPWS